MLVSAGAPENLLAWPVCLIVGAALPFVREMKSRGLKRLALEIARYSYGIYLVHGWAIWVCLEETSPTAPRALAFLLLTAGGAFAAFHLVEKPGMKLGGRAR